MRKRFISLVIGVLLALPIIGCAQKASQRSNESSSSRAETSESRDTLQSGASDTANGSQATNVDREGVVHTGLENLVEQNFAPLKGKKVGMIVNQTSRTSAGKTGPELFAHQSQFTLVALYTPEHGLFGQRQAGVESDSLAYFEGVPVYSLYGSARKPTKAMIKGVDALVFDIQDIGVRPYTYLSTMILTMEAAAEQGIAFYVLDRPNPLSGERVEGNVLDVSLKSFVGQVPVPYLPGMTLGELAKMAVGEGWFNSASKLKLTVVPLVNWRRAMYWPETGLSWTAPSPNIPGPENAVGAAMLGATGELGFLSIGIGTKEPFLRVGSNLVGQSALSSAVRSSFDPAVTVKDEPFTATTSAGPKSYKAGVKLLLPTKWSTIGQMYAPQYSMLSKLLATPAVRDSFNKIAPTSFTMFQKVTGTYGLADSLRRTGDVQKLQTEWKSDAQSFRELRAKYLIYK